MSSRAISGQAALMQAFDEIERDPEYQEMKHSYEPAIKGFRTLALKHLSKRVDAIDFIVFPGGSVYRENFDTDYSVGVFSTKNAIENDRLVEYAETWGCAVLIRKSSKKFVYDVWLPLMMHRHRGRMLPVMKCNEKRFKILVGVETGMFGEVIPKYSIESHATLRSAASDAFSALASS